MKVSFVEQWLGRVPKKCNFPFFAFAHLVFSLQSTSRERERERERERPFAIFFFYMYLRSLTVRSPCVHRPFTMLSVSVHKTFTIRSSFPKLSAIFIRNSNVKGSFRIAQCSKQVQWQNKEVTWWMGGRILSLYIRNLIVNYKASGLSTVKIQRKISLLRIRNFINRHKKSKFVVDHRYSVLFYNIQIKKKRSISFICLHYKIPPSPHLYNNYFARSKYLIALFLASIFLVFF